MKTQYLLFVCLVLGSVLFGTGCLNGNVNFGGKVTFSDDGSPLTMGTVCFESPGFLARGELDKDGKYDLGSLSASDGVPKGTYQVYITGAAKGGTNDRGELVPIPLIDPKFTSANTGMTVTIDGNSKSYDIKVDRYQENAKKK